MVPSRASSMDRSHLRHVHHLVVMSVLATSFHYVAYASGASVLPSGVAGALSGSIPLFAVLGAAVVLGGERITGRKLAGVVAGFGGVLVVARPWTGGGALDVPGVLFMLIGSASVGLSFVYAKRYLTDLAISPAALTTYQMGLGLLTLAVVTDLDGITAIGGDPEALAGLVVGLGLLGPGVAYSRPGPGSGRSDRMSPAARSARDCRSRRDDSPLSDEIRGPNRPRSTDVPLLTVFPTGGSGRIVT